MGSANTLEAAYLPPGSRRGTRRDADELRGLRRPGARAARARRRAVTALGGRGGLVLLVGEAGIGKTRLADELAQRADADGMAALWGRCWEAEGRPPYWPWVQILRALSRRAGRAPQRSRRAELPHLAQILPELASACDRRAGSKRSRPASVCSTPPRRLPGRARRATRRCSSIVDDLHSADLPSLRLLAVRRPRAGRRAAARRSPPTATSRRGSDRRRRGARRAAARRAPSAARADSAPARCGRFVELAAGRPLPRRARRRASTADRRQPVLRRRGRALRCTPPRSSPNAGRRRHRRAFRSRTACAARSASAWRRCRRRAADCWRPRR